MADPVDTVIEALDLVSSRLDVTRGIRARGMVTAVGDGVAMVKGLDHVGFEELLAFDSGAFGMAYDLREDATGAILLGGGASVYEGDGVFALGRLPELPVGAACLGRILDPLGNPLDERPPLPPRPSLPLFRGAPEIVERKRVDETLWTGITAVDAAIPIGRGQRELIVGDRNVGKTALAVDILVAQKRGDVACVYVVIGQAMSRVLTLRDTLVRAGCMENTVIIAADAGAPPGMQFLAPYAGASMAEWFRDSGGHALVVYDDLTKHADAYRELALLLDRPPGREAYPGDIFYIHAELLERATALSRGGSVTAFPLVETTDGDISSYIPTNLISITDGQIYLDTQRFERDVRPAIDVGRSVSRVGAVAEPPPLRQAAQNLRVQLSRFEALEALARVGLDLGAETQSALRQGRLLRELLRQDRLSPRSIADEVVSLTAVMQGWLEGIDPATLRAHLQSAMSRARPALPDLFSALDAGTLVSGDWQSAVRALMVTP